MWKEERMLVDKGYVSRRVFLRLSGAGLAGAGLLLGVWGAAGEKGPA